MPIYTYTCDNCGDQEILQSITDDMLTQCPRCDTISFRKTFNQVGIVFRGNGFYTTDSRKK